MRKKKNGSTAGSLPAIRIGTRVRCTDDGVEGRIDAIGRISMFMGRSPLVSG